MTYIHREGKKDQQTQNIAVFWPTAMTPSRKTGKACDAHCGTIYA
jgi:hypothetical protein